MTKKTKKILLIIGGLAILWTIGKFTTPPSQSNIKNYETSTAKEGLSEREVLREAHYQLMDKVRSVLNDPKSFDLLDKKGWKNGDGYIVMIEFTANNGFGGKVRKSVQAEADSKGNITKVFGLDGL